MNSHCPLVSVQTAVTILVRQRPDLVHAGDWQIIPQVVPHLFLCQQTSIWLQRVENIIVFLLLLLLFIHL